VGRRKRDDNSQCCRGKGQGEVRNGLGGGVGGDGAGGIRRRRRNAVKRLSASDALRDCRPHPRSTGNALWLDCSLLRIDIPGHTSCAVHLLKLHRLYICYPSWSTFPAQRAAPRPGGRSSHGSARQSTVAAQRSPQSQTRRARRPRICRKASYSRRPTGC
jgi:hypothetical protein